jgi:hypothetical protein
MGGGSQQQFKTSIASAAQPALATSVQQLLDLHGSWDQSIKVTMPGRGGVTVPLVQGCCLPVALFEYEVVACVQDATEVSGLKWWLRTYHRCQASGVRPTQYTWGTLSFVCPHSRKGYTKQIKDNSRDSRHKTCLDCKCKLIMSGEIVRCFYAITCCSSNKFQVDDNERTALVATASSWQGLATPFTVQFESRVQLSDTRRVYFFASYNV